MKTLYTTIIILTTSLIISACGSGTIETTSETMKKIEAFKDKEKFIEDDEVFYPGISDKSLQSNLSEKINLAADDFAVLASKSSVSEIEYQNAIKKGLERFRDDYLNIDTEDRERICMYFEELMDIVGLESSGGHLNTFMYGDEYMN